MISFSVPAKARADLMVAQSAKILKRFYFLERELIVLQAGWIPGTSHWESKLLLPEVLWESSVFAHELRQRILELRYPERRIAAEEDAGLIGLFRRFGSAPSAAAFVLALAEEIKPWFREAYLRYQSLADRLDDGPSQFLLRHGVADLDGQISRLRTVASAGLKAFPAEAEQALAWNEAVAKTLRGLPSDALLAEEVPVPPPAAELPSLEKPLAISRRGVRDPRFHLAAFAWPDRIKPGNPGQGEQLQVRQAVHHANEVWAAEMAAACIFDLTRDAPHEFLDDAARWCYDEIRHCRMGYERLKAWGVSDAEIPLDSFSYDAGAAVDAITRLGIIFYFESTYIHTKKERTLIFAELGDRVSSHDMDFDWADELIHTYYGKRWLDHFLREEGGKRTVTEVKEAARQAVANILDQVTESDRTAADEIFRRLLLRLAPDTLAQGRR